MSPHEEIPHLDSAFRQLGTERLRLGLVRRIRDFAILRLSRIADTRDLTDPEIYISLSLDVSRDEQAARKSPDRKARYSPSERSATKLLRLSGYAMECGKVTEQIWAQILHAYSGLEDSERALGAKRLKSHIEFGKRHGAAKRKAATASHKKWRDEARKVWEQPKQTYLSALSCARIVVRRLSLTVKPDHVSRIIGDLKPKVRGKPP